MYQLKIKSGGVWHDADLSNKTDVASTFEEAGIAEMSLKGKGTQEITLPVTATNCRIFGHADDKMIVGNIPYTKLECRLFNDGITIFGEGSFLVILRVSSEGYVVSILGGPCDLFTALRNISFDTNPTVLGTARQWSLNFQPSVEANGIRHERSAAGNAETSLPLIPLSTIKTALESATGYDLPSEVFKPDYYISFVDRKRSSSRDEMVAFDVVKEAKGSYVSMQLRIQEQELYYLANGNSLLPKNVKGVGLKATIVLKAFDTNYSNVRFSFTLGYNGTWKTFYYNLNGKPSNNGFTLGYDIMNGIGIQCYYKNVYFWSDGSITDEAGSVQPGSGFVIGEVAENPTSIYWGYSDYIETKEETVLGVTYITYSPNYPNGCLICRVQPLIKHDNDYAEAYGEMNIAENIGYKNALELYKALTQTFGYITHIVGNKASVYTIGDVVAAKETAVDWSSKLIECEDSFEAEGYSRINKYAFKRDDDFGVEVSKVIVSPDETLQEEQTVEIAFLSGSSSVGFAWAYIDEENAVKWRKLSSPYLLKLVDGVLRFTDASEMSAYDDIQQLFPKWRRISAKMVLSATDVLAFKHSKPIYLRQYGAYFYVSKISNWRDKTTCEVDLIRI